MNAFYTSGMNLGHVVVGFKDSTEELFILQVVALSVDDGIDHSLCVLVARFGAKGNPTVLFPANPNPTVKVLGIFPDAAHASTCIMTHCCERFFIFAAPT